MAKDKFKLPRSSYEELARIIKSYGHFVEPASLDQLSKLVGIGPTAVSANNAFLINVEVLEKGQKKVASKKGKSLAQALEHVMPDEIQRHWRQVVDENEFLSKLVASIRIRNGMDGPSLESHIAYSAGESKSAGVKTGARTVIDILRASGAIEEADGKFVVSENTTISRDEPPRNPDPDSREREPVESVTMQNVVTNTGGLQIRVEVKVECTFDQLDELGDKLVQLRETLSQSPELANDSNTEVDE